MGVAKKTRKFGQVKRMIGRRDARLKTNQTPQNKQTATPSASVNGKVKDVTTTTRYVPQAPSHLFFEANEALVPPYRVILDTNFISHTIRNKIDLLDGLMDALLASCVPVITECTIAELQKLGDKFRLALRVAKDERWQRLKCSHTGTYADDCILTTVMQNRVYLVGTDDKQLRQRLRKVPGVPLLGVGRGKISVERLPGGMV